MQQAQRVVAITGANGFIGLHLVNTFLTQNYKVVATVRDSNNAEKVKDLKKLPNQQNLTIVSADCLNAESFVNAFKGVDSVVHNASPLSPGGSENQEDAFVKPAVQGVQNAMEAVLKNEGIKNFVQVSSMAAVCGAPGSKPDDHKFSDKDWSDPDNQRERKSWYSLSKTLAEKQVWSYKDQFLAKGINIVTVCPTLVLGPILSETHQSESTKMIQKYISGGVEQIPNFSMSLVDVRDVALMCFQAVNTNAIGRYICVQQGYTIEQIVNNVRSALPEGKGDKMPTKVAEGKPVVPSLFNLDRSIQLLGQQFIPGEQSIKDMVQSWVQNKQV